MPMTATGTLTRNLSGRVSLASGFTLVELLVVIVVLGLISALTLPLLTDRGAGSENNKLRRVAGTVKQLYNEATLTRDEYLLTFDLDNNRLETYRLHSGQQEVEKEAFGRPLDMDPLRVRQITVKGQGVFRSGRISVMVYPLGWMEATEVVFTRGDGRTVDLFFSPLTGTATINEERSQL